MPDKSVTQRAAEAFGDWPPARPPVVVQDAAELAPATPAEAFTFAVDTAISAWAYWRTSEGRDERRDGLEIFAAAMDGLCEARQRYGADPCPYCGGDHDRITRADCPAAPAAAYR